MNRPKTSFTMLLSGLLMLFLAACGTAGPYDTLQSPEYPQTPGEKGGQSSIIPPAEGSPQPPNNEVEEANEVVVKQEISETGAAVSIVDNKGIAIGFTEDGHAYRGNPSAAVVLEEFSDFQCPFCSRFTDQTLPSLEQNQIAAGDVLLVYYDFPLESIHPQAFAAANAARCAGDQGIASFWQMHDLLHANAQQWSNANHDEAFINFATQLNLDLDQFTSCVEDIEHQDAIQSDIDHALSRGVRSTPSFFLNGQPLVGAQPVQVFDQAIAAVMSGETLAAAEQPSAAPDGGLPLEPPRNAPTPAAISDDNMAFALGDIDAPVTIVEYSDYQCPFCQRHVQETMPSIMSDMIETGQVRYIFKDLPLESLHPEARAAANAARCAGEQDAYWEMHDKLFATQQEWGGQGAGADQVFVSHAAELGLDEAAFATCLEEERYASAVQDNIDEAFALGASATPYFFIEGLPIPGAQSYELFSYAVGLAEEGLLADAFDPGQPDVSESYSVGDPNAPVTIIEYTDYQCPYCSRHFNDTYLQIKKNFIDTGQVYYIFKDFPLNNIHPQAQIAAEAARCAGDQDAYLAMHDKLFSAQGEWQSRADAATLFTSYAVDLGLDNAAFDECLAGGQHQAAVLADLEEGTKLGVNGTPAFFINGYSMSGAQPYQIFEQAINQFLEEG